MIHVVVGLLFNSSGEILVTERMQHKFQGGRWEFPGGKVEENEKPFDALKRELHEEIGVNVISANPWWQVQHDYPDKIILLDVWKIDQFEDQPHGKEGQAVKWVTLSLLSEIDIPDANREIVERLLG